MSTCRSSPFCATPSSSFAACRPQRVVDGARGTGKSSLVRACLARFASDGLRLIEVDRHDLTDLPDITGQLAGRPERFVLFATTCRSSRAMLVQGAEGRAGRIAGRCRRKHTDLRDLQPAPPDAGVMRENSTRPTTPMASCIRASPPRKRSRFRAIRPVAVVLSVSPGRFPRHRRHWLVRFASIRPRARRTARPCSSRWHAAPAPARCPAVARDFAGRAGLG